MPEWTQIVHRPGRSYRVGVERRQWVAAVRCDCVLGPHWHDVAVASTRTALLAKLDQDCASSLEGGDRS